MQNHFVMSRGPILCEAARGAGIVGADRRQRGRCGRRWRRTNGSGTELTSSRKQCMAASSKGRFIVRAEIRTSSESVISYGLELTQTSVFVVTEWHASIGTPVSVRLSFPRIL